MNIVRVSFRIEFPVPSLATVISNKRKVLMVVGKVKKEKFILYIRVSFYSLNAECCASVSPLRKTLFCTSNSGLRSSREQ